jgi:hypothetical protein
MEIKADEISKIIQKQIEGLETEVDIRENLRTGLPEISLAARDMGR